MQVRQVIAAAPLLSAGRRANVGADCTRGRHAARDDWKRLSRIIDSELDTNTFNESLILAQDERWRRA